MKYGIPPCRYQYSIGREHPCCDASWAQVLTGARSYSANLLRKDDGLAATACRPGTWGEDCLFGQEEQQRRES